MQRPSGASMPALLNRPEARIDAVNWTPHAAAAPIAPPAMAVWLMCALTMEEEHAVSTAKDGPLRPNTNDRRPAATDRTLPWRTKALTSVEQGPTWSWMSASRAARCRTDALVRCPCGVGRCEVK